MITTTNKEYAKVLTWIIHHRSKDIVAIMNIHNIREKEKLRLLNLIVPVSKYEHYISHYAMSTHSVLAITGTNLIITIAQSCNRLTEVNVEEM